MLFRMDAGMGIETIMVGDLTSAHRGEDDYYFLC